jgi:TetR/AcrR family transcriptional regulator, lmrAB and yxaGH operons repressor
MTTRDTIIDATCELLEAQGYHATGLSKILETSGAPKGSLYYYFPEGKEALAEEAVARAGALTADRIRNGLAGRSQPAHAVRTFVLRIAEAVEASGFRAGGPLQSIALETATTSPRLNAACQAAYQRLRQAFADRLAQGGYAPARAAALATVITAAIEGGIILSRTFHTGDPLRQVARELGRLLSLEEQSGAEP